MNEEQQVLRLQVAADAFEPSEINLGYGQQEARGETATGLFLNHDVQFSRAGSTGVSSLLEGGLFGRFGGLSSEVVLPNFLGFREADILGEPTGQRPSRESARLTVGDSITSPDCPAILISEL